MNHSELERSKDQLTRQLLFFDEEWNGFINAYMPERTSARSGVERLMTRYVSELERLVADFTPERLHASVLIGSTVRLRYPDEGETESWTIVFPDRADFECGRISFLSPVGLQLLLATAGETRTLETPAGGAKVEVEQVRYTLGGDLTIGE